MSVQPGTQERFAAEAIPRRSLVLAPATLSFESIWRLPTSEVAGSRISALSDLLEIDDWANCSTCQTHAPHARGQCLVCGGSHAPQSLGPGGSRRTQAHRVGALRSEEE